MATEVAGEMQPEMARVMATYCSPLLPTAPHCSPLLPTAPHCSLLLPTDHYLPNAIMMRAFACVCAPA